MTPPYLPRFFFSVKGMLSYRQQHRIHLNRSISGATHNGSHFGQKSTLPFTFMTSLLHLIVGGRGGICEIDLNTNNWRWWWCVVWQAINDCTITRSDNLIDVARWRRSSVPLSPTEPHKWRFYKAITHHRNVLCACRRVGKSHTQFKCLSHIPQSSPGVASKLNHRRLCMKWSESGDDVQKICQSERTPHH